MSSKESKKEEKKIIMAEGFFFSLSPLILDKRGILNPNYSIQMFFSVFFLLCIFLNFFFCSSCLIQDLRGGFNFDLCRRFLFFVLFYLIIFSNKCSNFQEMLHSFKEVQKLPKLKRQEQQFVE